MDYSEAMDYINSIEKFGMNPGLGRVDKLLEYMGNPHSKLKCIHVAGTNGKGSITSMISSILMECGYKVGMYTSPHLQRFTERIKVDNIEITEEETAGLISYMKPLAVRVSEEGLGHPTQFGIITAAMFKYFNEKSVDYGVIEVGLGGRLDATNVINPLVSVIASISYDHMNVLGNTIESIANEKAGIIKEGGIVVSYPQEKAALDVIREVCTRRKASLLQVDNSGIKLKDYNLSGQIFDMEIKGELYENIRIGLIGGHQLLNAKTAVTAVLALSTKGACIDRNSIYEGLRKASWPGRLEVVSNDPVIILDGAHNLQGIGSLKNALQKYFRYKKLIIIMGVLGDKQVEDMCSLIMPLAHTVVAVQPLGDRAMPYEELCSIASRYCDNVKGYPDIEEALEYGVNTADKDDLLLFCGSLYMIGYVRELMERRGILKK